MTPQEAIFALRENPSQLQSPQIREGIALIIEELLKFRDREPTLTINPKGPTEFTGLLG